MPQHKSKASARDKDAKNDDGDADGLVKRVIEFFFDNDEFAHTFEAFAQENCRAFDLHDDEMKLEYVGRVRLLLMM